MVPAVIPPGGHCVRQGLLFTPELWAQAPHHRARRNPAQSPREAPNNGKYTVILTPVTSPAPRRFPTPPSPLPGAQTRAGDRACPATRPQPTWRRATRALPGLTVARVRAAAARSAELRPRMRGRGRCRVGVLAGAGERADGGEWGRVREGPGDTGGIEEAGSPESGAGGQRLG